MRNFRLTFKRTSFRQYIFDAIDEQGCVLFTLKAYIKHKMGAVVVEKICDFGSECEYPFIHSECKINGQRETLFNAIENKIIDYENTNV